MNCISLLCRINYLSKVIHAPCTPSGFFLLLFMAIGGVSHASETQVTLSSGILTITDINGASSNDALSISYSGGTYTITDSGGLTINTAIGGSSGSGTASVTVPDSGVNGINFNLLAGDDSITVTSVQSAFSDDFTITSGTGELQNLDYNIH